MRIFAAVVLLVLLAAGRSVAQTPLLDRALAPAAAFEARVAAAVPQSSEVPSLRLALPASTTKEKHALGETLLIIGGGAILVGALAGGGGGTVVILGGVACAAYGVYLIQL